MNVLVLPAHAELCLDVWTCLPMLHECCKWYYQAAYDAGVVDIQVTGDSQLVVKQVCIPQERCISHYSVRNRERAYSFSAERPVSKLTTIHVILYFWMLGAYQLTLIHQSHPHRLSNNQHA